MNIHTGQAKNGGIEITKISALIIILEIHACSNPLALIGIQGTIFSEHEVFRVYELEIVFIFTLSIFLKKCENNERIISFNYKIHNLHKIQNILVSNTISILI